MKITTFTHGCVRLDDGGLNSWFERVTDNGYRYLAPGESLET